MCAAVLPSFPRSSVIPALFSLFFAAVPAAGDEIIAQVGRFAVRNHDVEIHRAIAGCYAGPGLTRPQALFQLLERAGLEVMLARRGVHVTDSLIEAEAQRIDRETQAPDILQAIKKVCGPRETYLRLFVRPIVVARTLHHHVAWARDLQAEERARAERAARTADSTGGGFKKAAEKAGLAYSLLHVWRKGEPEKRAQLDSRLRGNDSEVRDVPADLLEPEVRKAVDELPLGRASGVLEGKLAYYLVKVQSRTTDQAAVETASVLKRDLSAFATGFLTGVPLTCRDEETAGYIRDHPAHWLSYLFRPARKY